MKLRAFGICLLALAGCAQAPQPVEAPNTGQALRVASLDYCADQYVLALVGRERIAAVSPDAGAAFSYMRQAAEGLHRVRPTAEEVLALDPDLVVRSYGGGPNAAALFEAAGVRVVQVGWANDLDGVERVAREMGAALGAPDRGEALAQDVARRRAALLAAGSAHSTLYLTPAGYTTGPDTLIHALIEASGHANFETRSGWHALDLERLASERPELVAAAAFADAATAQDAWGLMRHPFAQAALASQPAVALEGAWTACGGWFVMDAAEALAAGGRP